MQTNNSKEKVRQLQNKLYLTAKKCDSRRFHALYDKVYRDDVLFVEAVLENLQEIEEDDEVFESIEELWPDYPSKEDFLFNEDEY